MQIGSAGPPIAEGSGRRDSTSTTAPCCTASQIGFCAAFRARSDSVQLSKVSSCQTSLVWTRCKARVPLRRGGGFSTRALVNVRLTRDLFQRQRARVGFRSLGFGRRASAQVGRGILGRQPRHALVGLSSAEEYAKVCTSGILRNTGPEPDQV